KMTDAVAALKDGGAYLKSALESLGFTALLGHANFLLADFGALRADVMRAFDERGIRVKDYGGDDFWSRFTRITLGPRSSMEQGVEVVQACVPAGQYAAGGGQS